MAMTFNDSTTNRVIQDLAGRSIYSFGVKGRVGVVDVHITVDEKATAQTFKNLDVLGEAIVYRMYTALGSVVMDVLAEAQPRVPYYPGGKRGKPSTGLLRESGRAYVTIDGGRETDVGKGHRSGMITAMMSNLRPTNIKESRSRLIGIVSYNRSEDGKDVALWTHESLLPEEDYPEAGGRTPGTYYARTAGTGPKYLELAWVENKARYMTMFKDAMKGFPTKVRRIGIVTKRAHGEYDIDRVELKRDKIAEVGYFNSALG